jgi:hypothetical protein
LHFNGRDLPIANRQLLRRAAPLRQLLRRAAPLSAAMNF